MTWFHGFKWLIHDDNSRKQTILEYKTDYFISQNKLFFTFHPMRYKVKSKTIDLQASSFNA
ncbi:hypothetical protein DEM91_04970 [Prevotella sp. TCVGH]|nr:hypothetical protein [Prevotella sp. TCVGH]